MAYGAQKILPWGSVRFVLSAAPLWMHDAKAQAVDHADEKSLPSKECEKRSLLNAQQ
jgi:hypothetical protein